MFFGHLPELLGLLVIALLVFGPKRMIEMGSQLGKAFREFKASTKDLNWTSLLSGAEQEKPTALSHLSQLSQTFGAANGNSAAPEADSVVTTARVVDAAEPGEEPSAN